MNASEKDLFAMKLNNHPVVKGLVALGAAMGRLLPIRNRSSLFFFFPFYHVGGAEKVHAAIVNCFSTDRPWVFFTKKSVNNGFLSFFGPDSHLHDLWFLLKYSYPFSVGVMAGFINKHQKPVVFGSNSLFYYLLLPYLKKEVRRIDLMHAFGGGSEDFSFPVAEMLDARVAINSRTVADFKEQYAKHGLRPSLAERVVLIENAVQVPHSYPQKPRHSRLKVLYVGRGSEEKRVHLVGRVAARCANDGVPIEVSIVGDAINAVDPADREHCTFLGEISDAERLGEIYKEADLLLITSSREGFPMVIMEGMAHGVVPISTAVGGIPVHVAQGSTGFLVESSQNEEQIVEEMSRVIRNLSERPDLLDTMSRAAYGYARAHFGGDRFCSSYRSLLLGSPAQPRL